MDKNTAADLAGHGDTSFLERTAATRRCSANRQPPGVWPSACPQRKAQAEAFLFDKDSPGPEEKLLRYYEHVVKS